MNFKVVPKLRSLLWGCIVISTVGTALLASPLGAYNTTTSPLNDMVAYLNDSSISSNQRNATLDKTLQVSGGDTEVFRNEISENASQRPLVLDNVTEHLNNVTTVNDEGEDDDVNNASRLNLAVIPVVAILVFLTGICLKGCSWFRQYSRGSKDTPGAYDIVEEGDDDFDEIEMRTDSASTVYYDTVSSFCSFLRKNEMDISANTLTGSRFQQLKQEHNVSEKLLRDVRKRMAELEATDRRRTSDNRKGIECIAETESDENPSDTSKLLFNTEKRRVTRTPSGSSDVSADTEQSLLSDTEKDTPVKRQRFKVSFVTEKFDSKRKTKQTGDSNILRPIITNPKTSHATMTDATNVSRPRTQSSVPINVTQTIRKCSDDSDQLSSKPCSSNGDKRTIRNTANTKEFGVRSKISPIGTRRSLRSERSPKALYRGRSLDSKYVVYAEKSARGKRDIVTDSNTGLYPEMIDRAIQTDKSFRLSVKRGRKRYYSETYADENVIPPTISELVEMCQCSSARNSFVNSRNNACVCNNSLDDICDDVFDNNDSDTCTLNTSSKECMQNNVTTDKLSNEDNRLTNHEWNSGHMCPVSRYLNTTAAGNNDEISHTLNPSDQSAKHSRDIRDVMSVSTHNISDNKNDSNGNLLAKYCDKCQNINRSVPNLCCACQIHAIDSETSSVKHKLKGCKNKCKSCSHFNWTHLTSPSPGQRTSNIGESRTKLYKRESSLASEDLSVSSSSLSSSGYVENSSDVSSA